MAIGIYNAEISAGSLMLPESRRVARLLLTHPTKEQWFQALKVDNVLQKKSPATARRQARLIRNRLDTLEHEAWSLIAEGSQEVATQLLFAAAIKHSRVLADFLRDVYAGHLRRLEQNISPRPRCFRWSSVCWPRASMSIPPRRFDSRRRIFTPMSCAT